MPYELVSIVSLMLAIAFVWFPQRHLWVAPFVVFLVTGLTSGWLLPASLFWGSVLASIVYFHMRASTPIAKSIALGCLVLVALYFGVHLVPGFELTTYLEDTRLSESSGWNALNFSADKPLVGLFLLVAYRERLCRNPSDWRAAFTVSVIPTLLGISFIYAIGIWAGYITVDLSLSPLVMIWFARNLLFTVVAEELLFRQIIQFHIEKALSGVHAKLLALLVASVMFGAVHLWGGWQYGMLAALAGLIYGYAYMRSRRIEMAIMAHVALNTGHVLFFSYPFASHHP